MTGRSALGLPSTSPFSPNFGRAPQSLVGRDDLLADLGGGLATGPHDARYTSVLMGVRGSGKTVLLSEIEDRAAADGWVVLSLDAGTPGLLDRIVQTVRNADRTYEALGMANPARTRSAERSVGIRLGPLAGQISVTEHDDRLTHMGLREYLTFLAQAARRSDTSVLLTVDEMHGIDRTEGRRLSNDIQHITKRGNMPLAFVGAGLLEMKTTLLQDRKMTFFHRCEHYEMPPLDASDAMIGLASPIRDAGGTITDEALELAAKAVGASPYKLQVIGDFAWRIAGAPEKSIDAVAARTAVQAADKDVRKKVALPAWHDLSRTDQRVLVAVASIDGGASPQVVAQRAGLSGDHAQESLSRLRKTGYLDRPRAGTYRLTDLVPLATVLDEGAILDETDSGAAPLCRQWMPQSNAYCILNQGHSGGHRSRHRAG
ncbi:ATP-binding protein [Candidatus Poriferisodalis sp.]|uniref:ATP-binding protein n=1 Tax=Candidatus Poriferisodalis sp. TaxID=3101277 RepID=UPI003B0227AC